MIILRQADFSDYSAIAELHADSWKKNYRGIYSDRFLENEVDKDRLNVWFQRLESPVKNQLTTVAVLNNTIVGFSCAFLNDDPVFGSLIDNLHVTTTSQKSGIGKMLLADCAASIIQKGDNKKMYLWVYDSNHNAKAFYERLGGTKFETIEKTNTDGTTAMSCRYTWDDRIHKLSCH